MNNKINILNMKINTIILLFALMVVASGSMAQNPVIVQNQNGFTQADRDRLIRMEAILDQHEKRFEDINTSVSRLYILFGSITIFLIGLIVWDRRSLLGPLEKKVKVLDLEMEEIKKGTRLEKTISVLQDMAKDNPKIAEILKNNNLL